MGGVTIAIPRPPEPQPQQPGILQQYAQMMGIQGQQQERQIRSAQLQQQQEALRQTQILNDAVRKNTDANGRTNHDAVMRDMAANGAGKDLISYRTNLASANKAQLEAEEQRVKTVSLKLDTAAKFVGGANTPQDWEAAKQHVSQELGPELAANMGDYSPEQKQKMLQMGMSAKDNSDYALKLIQDQRAKEEHDAKLPGEKADSRQKVLTLAGTNPQGLTANQQSEAAARKRTGDIESAKLSEEKRYHDIQSGMGGPTAGGVTGPAQMSQVPEAIKGTVQGILDYRQNMPPMTRSNPRNSLIQYWVNKLDPSYDSSQFPARNKLIQNYTSGPQSKEINAINTAMGHVGVLGDALKALDNGDVKAINSIANKVGIQVGQTPAATVNLIVHRVGPELTSAYVQGGGGEADRGTTASDFDTSLGKDILKQNVSTTGTLLRSKISSLENQYKQTVKRDDFQQRFITPEAQAALDKYSPKGAAAASQGGGTHVIQIGDKKYQYKGSGNTADLSNYSELPK